MAIKRLAAWIFVHFQDPVSGEPEFADKERRRPVGVKVHTPGSVEAKKVETRIIQINLDRQSKKITAAQLEQSALGRLIGNTFEFVNFDAVPGFEDKEYSSENAREFYTDPELAHLRDQVQEKLGDFSAGLQAPENS